MVKISHSRAVICAAFSCVVKIYQVVFVLFSFHFFASRRPRRPKRGVMEVMGVMASSSLVTEKKKKNVLTT